MAQQLLKGLLRQALTTLQESGKLPENLACEISVGPSKSSVHGDFSSNLALLLAKQLALEPRAVAQLICAALPSSELVDKVQVAAPGFINFYLQEAYYHEVLQKITNQADNFGRSEFGQGQRVLVEYVSANPTGPLHVGHGRGAAFGATIANLLQAVGFKVHREYYVNDAGRQMHILAVSIWLRYLELEQRLPHFPSNGYRGAYITLVAHKLKQSYGSSLQRNLALVYQELPADAEAGGDQEFYIDALIQRTMALLGPKEYQLVFQLGITEILADIRDDLAEFGVTFDEWFYESHLIKNGDVTRSLEILQEHGSVYAQDEALWFKATEFGDEKDRVLVRSNGQTTYFASDVGYHLNKYARGFDQLIDIFGADHHGYLPRIHAFLQALHLDPKKLTILLVQFAVLYRGAQKVQMSTRSGEFVTLRQLRQEVGTDAARFFYIMRKNDQHLDFDLELAKSQSTANPVYYIQYAHARICSVLRQVVETGLTYDLTGAVAHLTCLTTEQEYHLLRQLSRYSAVLHSAAITYEPHLLANYLRELAGAFHTYYNAQQFLVADGALRSARLYLINAVKQVLGNGLALLGISAPEAM